MKVLFFIPETWNTSNIYLYIRIFKESKFIEFIFLSKQVDAVIKNDKKVELHKISGIDGAFIGKQQFEKLNLKNQ